MFGGLLTVPLYLQIVKGSSPTEAGLQLIPFVIGIMAGSIISGQLIARTGRYRIFPIIGTALMVVALLPVLADRRGHPAVEDHADHGVMGLGLGGNMQPMILAVQNAVVAARDRRGDLVGDVLPARWAARSARPSSCRCCSASLPGKIEDGVQAARRTPEFQAALAATRTRCRRSSRPHGGQRRR